MKRHGILVVFISGDDIKQNITWPLRLTDTKLRIAKRPYDIVHLNDRDLGQ